MNVVDERQQRRRRGVDRSHVVGLLVVERRVEHELGHADHAVEGCADLVADVGEKAALRKVGGLRRALRFLKTLEQHGDVGREDDEPQREAPDQVRMGGPERAQEGCAEEARQAEGGREHQVAAAEAEAVAEGDPQIHDEEGRADVATRVEDRGGRTDVEHDAQDAARHDLARVDRDPRDDAQSQRHEQPADGEAPRHLGREPQLEVDDSEVGDADGEDDGADDRLLGLGVRGLREALAPASHPRGEAAQRVAG
ncbi:MAG: hypothetical protein MUF57_09495 [Gammaproteobacteria bacterium]|nr:hypothetical protein [Gammaproteobacteria bacterium]